MMVPGQAVFGGVGQYAPQHPAQRVARQHVVSDMIGRHYISPVAFERAAGQPAAPPLVRLARFPMLPRRRPEVSKACRRCRKFQQKAEACTHNGHKALPARFAPIGGIKWRLLLPGASEPRPAELNPLGLQTWFFKPLTRPEQPEHSCRLQLLHSPITAEPYREKTRPLRPRRSWFAPAETHCFHGLWWRRRVLPPGPNGLLRRQFISIAGKPAGSI